MKKIVHSSRDKRVTELFSHAPTKGERTKFNIIEGAITCIASLGIEKTTLEAIASRAGIAKSHVVYHFPDKDDIFLAAIRYVTSVAQQITVERIKVARNLRDRVAAILDGAIEWAENYPTHVPVLIQFYQFCTYRSEFRKMHTHIRAAGFDRIHEALKEEYQLRSPEKLSSLAQSIHSLMIGNILEWVTTNRWKNHLEVRKATLQGIDLLLGKPTK